MWKEKVDLEETAVHTHKGAASAVTTAKTRWKAQPPECTLHRDAVY